MIIGHHLFFIGLYSLKALLVSLFKSLLNMSLLFLTLIYPSYHYVHYLMSLSYEQVISTYSSFL